MKELDLTEKELSKLTAEQIERRKELAQAQKDCDNENAKRSGIGTRMFAGQTRGKGALVIKYENFDTSKPETCPTSIQGFMENTGTKAESELVAFLIEGYNNDKFTSASDPLAEYVNEAWSPEVQNQFRITVRNYARGAETSIEEAVTLIKPGFDKKFGK